MATMVLLEKAEHAFGTGWTWVLIDADGVERSLHVFESWQDAQMSAQRVLLGRKEQADA